MLVGEVRRIKIGQVGVDSGQLLIADPCYIRDQRGLAYDEILRARTESGGGDMNQAPKYLQLKYDQGHDGIGVVFNSGFGDGMYEVYATIEDFGDLGGERIVKVEVITVTDVEKNKFAELVRRRTRPK